MLALLLLPLPFALPFPFSSGPVVRMSLERARDGVRERSRFTPLHTRWLAGSLSASVRRRDLAALASVSHTQPKGRDFAVATFHRFRKRSASSHGLRPEGTGLEDSV